MLNRPFVVSSIQYFLLAAVFLIPIFSIDHLAYSVIEKTLLFYLLVELAFGFWLYLILKDRAYLPSTHPLLLSGAAFLLVYILATIFASDPAIAFWSTMSRMTGLLLLLHIAAFTAMLASVFRDERSWRMMLGTAVVSGVLSALPAYAVLWSGDDSFAKSTFGNDSYTAAYLTFALFFSFLLIVKAKTRIGRSSYAIAAFIIILSPIFIDLRGISNIITDPLALIGTARAATVSIMIGSMMAALAFATTISNQVVAKIGKVGFLLSTLVLLSLSISVFVPGTVQEKVGDLGLGSRLIFWASAVEGIKERPVLGFGPENYFVPFYRHFEPDLLTEEYYFEVYTSKPHSAYLEILVSGGVLAFIAYLSIWLAVFWLLWRLWQKGQIGKPEISVVIGLVVAYLLQNIVLFDTLSSYMGIGMVFAYLLHLSADRKDRPYKNGGRISWPLLLIVSIVTLTTLYFATLMPYRQQREMIRLMEEVTVAERADSYGNLFAMSPSLRASMAEYLMNKVLVALPAAIPKATSKERELMLKDVSSLRQTVQTYAPEAVNYRHDLYLSRLMLLELVLEEDVSEREALLESVAELEVSLEKLSPNNPQNSWVRAQRQIFERKGESALDTLRASNESTPNIAGTMEKIEAVKRYLAGESDPPFFTD